MLTFGFTFGRGCLLLREHVEDGRVREGFLEEVGHVDVWSSSRERECEEVRLDEHVEILARPYPAVLDLKFAYST